MAQLAIAWILSKEGVTAPIVGSTNLDNLKDIIGVSYRYIQECISDILFPAATEIELTEEEQNYLEEPYIPVSILGHS